MQSNQHFLIDVPYQGNWWWVFWALFSLFGCLRMLLVFWRKRQAGQAVFFGAVIVFCAAWLDFLPTLRPGGRRRRLAQKVSG